VLAGSPSPLDGILVPTFGGFYIGVTLLFPFVAIRFSAMKGGRAPSADAVALWGFRTVRHQARGRPAGLGAGVPALRRFAI
jgi:hypothetical protein